MKVIWEFLSFFIFLLEILPGFSNPIRQCKRGKFLEPNVDDYLDCKVCVEQPHYDNCETCCGSVTSTTSSTFTSSKPITPTSAPVKSLSKFESAKPEPTVHSYYDVKFFFQGTPLVAIIVAFTIGAIFSLVFILGILKLVNLYRKKVASGPRKPPIEETQADANSSPFVELSVEQSNHDTNSDWLPL